MRNTCVFAVIFPSNLVYFGDFITSLEAQQFKDFDIVLLNDGVENINELIVKYASLNFIVHSVSGTPAQIRQRGVGILMDSNYERVIFCDTDDYFSNNRISLSIELLEKHDVVVNDLVLVDKKGSIISELYFTERMADGFIFDYKFIVDKNILGFSNTAINKKALLKAEIGDETVAIDWIFFSTTITKNKLKVIFSNKAITYYRQHAQNTVGIGKVTEESILKAVKVKLQHYNLLKKTESLFAELYVKFYALSNKLKDNTFKNEYVKYVTSFNLKNPLWWEEAKEH